MKGTKTEYEMNYWIMISKLEATKNIEKQLSPEKMKRGRKAEKNENLNGLSKMKKDEMK